MVVDKTNAKFVSPSYVLDPEFKHEKWTEEV